tara:strand:+ start:5035 stop:9753 length:4719 start_codon:yes stop_codon:yes gene_type:complete
MFNQTKFIHKSDSIDLDEISEIKTSDELQESSLQQKETKEDKPLFQDNKFKRNPEIREYNTYEDLTPNYSVTQVERNPQAIKDFEVLTDFFGTNDRMSEWLRDANTSTTSLILRGLKATDAPDEVKQAYGRLQTNFNKAKLKTADEWWDFIKDSTIDIFADPITWASLIFAPVTAGTSVAATRGINELLKQGVKKLTVSQMLDASKRPAIFTAAEGAAWGGLHNYYRQDLDVDLHLREKINPKEIFKTMAATSVFGGALGGTVGAYNASRYFKTMQKRHNAEDQIKHADSVTRKDVVESELSVPSVSYKENTLDNLKENLVGGFFGKATSVLLTAAKSSPTLDNFLRNLRYDYGRTVFGKASDFIERTGQTALSYFEALQINGFGQRVGKLEQILNNTVGRKTSWKHFGAARMTKEDNDGILELLTTGGEATQFKTVNEQTKNITEAQRSAYLQIKKLLDDAFKDGADAELFAEIQKVKNYFPRLFSYSKLEKLRGSATIQNGKIVYDIDNSFLQKLIDNDYANPNNEFARSRYQKFYNAKAVKENKNLEELELELGLPADARTVDQEAFDFETLYPEQNFNSFEDAAISRLKTKYGDNFEDHLDEVVDLAKIEKGNAIIDGMLRLKDTPFEYRPVGNVGAGKGFLQHRVFTKINDDELREYLNDDVTEVLTDYFTNVTQAIERKKRFGLTLKDFEKDHVAKIADELKENGATNEQVATIVEKIRKLHKRTLGLEIDDGQGVFSKATKGRFKTASEWGRLSQQVAHLPLAVVSSITEPLIMLSRVGAADTPAAAGEIAKSMVKGVEKIIDRTLKTTYSTVTGKKIKFKDLDDDYWKELYDVGLALESATLDGLDRLASGDPLTGTLAKGFQNVFFKTNFLTQWTQAVQAASYVTGQKIIRRNAQKLYENQIGARTLSTGNFRNAGMNQKKYLTQQLNELGIDENDAINWYRSSLDSDKIFDVNKSRELDFYTDKLLPGAGRFVNEVILNPSIAAANKPLLFSHPAGQLLFQFAGYPTAFNNIVLKRFINESYNYPMSASPKVLATTLSMTTVALLGNYIRSEGRAFEEYDGRPKPEGEIIMDAWSRWGGLGFLDHGRRFKQNLKYGGGLIGSGVKSFTGPLPADFVDTLLYRKGPGALATGNIPFYGMFSTESRKNLRKAGRDFDKQLAKIISGEENSQKSIYDRANYRTGGPAVNVPNAPARPEERVNKNTGMPYDLEAGPTAQPEKDRKGFSEEGKLLATLERRQKKFTGGVENLVEDTVLDMVKNKSWFKRATEPEGELYKGKHTLLTTSMEADGKEYLFPTIREVNGKLKKLSNQAAFKEAMRKKDFLVFEGKDKREQATEVSKIISNLVMPTRNTRMKKNQGLEVEGYDSYLQSMRSWESDHGNTPIRTHDAAEKNKKESERSFDIAYGHKITDNELRTGKIYGIDFIDLKTGKYIPLTEEQKIFIQKQDVNTNVKVALDNGWKKELEKRNLNFENLPSQYKFALADLAYNVGGTKAGKSWVKIFDDIKNNNTASFVKNLRRQDGGRNTAGMDNRAAKAAFKAGLINNRREAIEYGLSLTNTNEIPK